MKNAVLGRGKETSLDVIGDKIIFLCDGESVLVAGEQSVFEELLSELKHGNACLMPFVDGFFSGIVVDVTYQ